jgi:hypothetical protein
MEGTMKNKKVVPPSPLELLGGKKEPEKPKEKGKPKHKNTHVEHLDDGSHVTTHIPRDGSPEVKYSSRDLDGVHDGLEEHLGEANQDEEAMVK